MAVKGFIVLLYWWDFENTKLKAANQKQLCFYERGSIRGCAQGMDKKVKIEAIEAPPIFMCGLLKEQETGVFSLEKPSTESWSKVHQRESPTLAHGLQSGKAPKLKY